MPSCIERARRGPPPGSQISGSISSDMSGAAARPMLASGSVSCPITMSTRRVATIARRSGACDTASSADRKSDRWMTVVQRSQSGRSGIPTKNGSHAGCLPASPGRVRYGQARGPRVIGLERSSGRVSSGFPELELRHRRGHFAVALERTASTVTDGRAEAEASCHGRGRRRPDRLDARRPGCRLRAA